jgi:transcriptional regulator with PAS, ATPase and Fis domain
VFTPLGAVHPVQADVRILAATNRDLPTDVGQGRFRQDLFFRLNIIRIHLPPLRARTEDIPLLVDSFIKKLNAMQGRHVTGISERAMAVLLRHDWPGNVRELENAIEHAFIVCGGSVLEHEDLPPHVLGEPLDTAETVVKPETDPLRPLQNAEATAIRAALMRNDGHRSRAAEELNISRSSLWRKMRRYGIE